MASKVPRDQNLTPEMRRFLDDISSVSNIFDGKTATEATALLNVFTSLLKGLVPASGGGTTTFLRADGTFAVPLDTAGAVIQCLQTTYLLNTDLTTALPIDDSVPLISEGAEILSLAITPADNTNKIFAAVSLFGSSASAWGQALFRGNTCLNAHWSAAGTSPASLNFLDSPASASAQTYSVRVGNNGGSAVRMNGTTLQRYFGGASACTLTLMEVVA